MKPLAPFVAALALWSGCLVRTTYAPQIACRSARAALPSLQRGGLSSKELVLTVASDERAFRHAKRAYEQGIVWTAMTVIGSGLLLSGLVMGFVTDPTKTDARIAGYSLAGAAIGVGAIATAVGLTAPAETRKAIRSFAEFTETCSEYSTPTEMPPPVADTPLRSNGSLPKSPLSGPAEAAPGVPKGEVYVPTPPPQ